MPPNHISELSPGQFNKLLESWGFEFDRDVTGSHVAVRWPFTNKTLQTRGPTLSSAHNVSKNTIGEAARIIGIDIHTFRRGPGVKRAGRLIQEVIDGKVDCEDKDWARLYPEQRWTLLTAALSVCIAEKPPINDDELIAAAQWMKERMALLGVWEPRYCDRAVTTLLDKLIPLEGAPRHKLPYAVIQHIQSKADEVTAEAAKFVTPEEWTKPKEPVSEGEPESEVADDADDADNDLDDTEDDDQDDEDDPDDTEEEASLSPSEVMETIFAIEPGKPIPLADIIDLAEGVEPEFVRIWVSEHCESVPGSGFRIKGARSDIADDDVLDYPFYPGKVTATIVWFLAHWSQARSRSFSPRFISHHVALNRQQCSGAMWRLEASGFLTRVARGKYMTTPQFWAAIDELERTQRQLRPGFTAVADPDHHYAPFADPQEIIVVEPEPTPEPTPEYVPTGRVVMSPSNFNPKVEVIPGAPRTLTRVGVLDDGDVLMTDGDHLWKVSAVRFP